MAEAAGGTIDAAAAGSAGILPAGLDGLGGAARRLPAGRWRSQSLARCFVGFVFFMRGCCSHGFWFQPSGFPVFRFLVAATAVAGLEFGGEELLGAGRDYLVVGVVEAGGDGDAAVGEGAA